MFTDLEASTYPQTQTGELAHNRMSMHDRSNMANRAPKPYALKDGGISRELLSDALRRLAG